MRRLSASIMLRKGQIAPAWAMTWHCGEPDRDLAGAELRRLFAWAIIDREKGPLRHFIGLQSGATGGAVSWGVLDRLLEDEQIEIEAVSDSRWGSVNAIACG